MSTFVKTFADEDLSAVHLDSVEIRSIVATPEAVLFEIEIRHSLEIQLEITRSYASFRLLHFFMEIDIQNRPVLNKLPPLPYCPDREVLAKKFAKCKTRDQLQSLQQFIWKEEMKTYRSVQLWIEMVMADKTLRHSTPFKCFCLGIGFKSVKLPREAEKLALTKTQPAELPTEKYRFENLPYVVKILQSKFTQSDKLIFKFWVRAKNGLEAAFWRSRTQFEELHKLLIDSSLYKQNPNFKIPPLPIIDESLKGNFSEDNLAKITEEHMLYLKVLMDDFFLSCDGDLLSFFKLSLSVFDEEEDRFQEIYPVNISISEAKDLLRNGVKSLKGYSKLAPPKPYLSPTTTKRLTNACKRLFKWTDSTLVRKSLFKSVDSINE